MANDSITLINNEALNSMAADMKTKSAGILETFNGDCTVAIKSTDTALQVAGLSSADVLAAFKKIFDGMNDKIVSLSSFITTTVNNEYSNTARYITEAFNNDVGAKLASLLNETNIGVITAGNGVES